MLLGTAFTKSITGFEFGAADLVIKVELTLQIKEIKNGVGVGGINFLVNRIKCL
jgi:hypothetical protein